MAKKKAAAPPEQFAGPSLIICRNKHWRYISSFHGPWLQLPPEILSSLAHQNYTMPSPRLIDPSVFYDIVKIRKAVDEASQDSVRASNGVATNANNNGGRMDMFGAPGGGTQLSKERVFKIRQKAVRLLGKAFKLDEVAASVATMQATSTVEDVGAHVLRREPNNPDAKYVHFFHEKIPSRAMEQYTPLEPLEEIISSLPMEQQAPPLRTRALVQIFKRQWEGAILDLTMALRITEELRRSHKPDQQQLELASRMREEQETWNKGYRDWRAVPQLKDEEQPSSLEKQLLFNRAGVYLTLACQSVHRALDGLKEYQEAQANGEVHGLDTRAQDVRLDARKRVKGFAKKAIKDYMAFLGHFDYTPGLSFEITNEIMRRVHDLANGNKTQTPLPKSRLVEVNASDDESSQSDVANCRPDNSNALVKHQNPKSEPFELGEDGWPKFPTPKIHPVSALFAEKPLPDLPPDTANDANANAHAHANRPMHNALNSREAVTYHPLMLDALHSLLLAHALIQTSATEHLRHAHNAARLARIADGYPLFQAARSPARADWIEVLRRANNWIGLSVPWQKMCTPAPLPDEAGGWARESTASSPTSSSPTPSDALAMNKHKSNFNGKEETPDQKRERIKQESIIDALSDDRVIDEDSFQRAVRARERRAIEDEEGISGPLKDKVPPKPAEPIATPNGKGAKRREQDESEKDYPISTDRAEAIARWIREAPLSMGGSKKKRPTRKKKPAEGVGSTGGAADGGGAAAEGVAEMRLNATT